MMRGLAPWKSLGWLRLAAIGFLCIVSLAALAAPWLAAAAYDEQFREFPNAAPSRQFLLGTDDLGRDRWSRLLHGTRISLLLAPAASLLAVLGAAVLGSWAAWRGGTVSGAVSMMSDLVLALPWLFLLITARAALPLDVLPVISILITFSILGLLGWAGPARVVEAAACSVLRSDYVRAARARGIRNRAIFWRHVIPNVRPVLTAQFFTCIPMFILAEANLGLLGLGVAEPLPSWGALLRELESQAAVPGELFTHYWLLTPVALLLLVVLSMQAVLAAEVNQ